MSTELTAPSKTGGSNGGGNKPASGKSPSGGATGGSAGGGFFKLYKPGQGYWTRLGTAIGAAAVILFISWFAFEQSALFLGDARGARFGFAAGVAALLALLTWWLMNGPRRAQFLIDTDSEMKKVNWEGWSQLIGSTRVVLFFMVLTAVILFTLDTQYHALFFGVGVWHVPFDATMGAVTGGLIGLSLLAIGIALWRGNRAEPTKRGAWSAAITLLGAIGILVAWSIFTARHLHGAA